LPGQGTEPPNSIASPACNAFVSRAFKAPFMTSNTQTLHRADAHSDRFKGLPTAIVGFDHANTPA
jgi:hypothetical protein